MITLKTIDAKDYEAVLRLRVCETDQRYVCDMGDLLKRLRRDDAKDTLLLVRHHAHVCGMLFIAEYETGKYFLKQMFIENPYQNKGVGKEALALLIERLKKGGFSSLITTVKKGNNRALRMFASAGFEFVDALEDKVNLILYG